MEPPGSSVKEIQVEEILTDMRAGMRTKAFLTKYGLELAEFQDILKQLIRQGLLSKEEFKAWKARRPTEAKGREEDPGEEDRPASSNIVTYVVTDPEKKNHWALTLFSTKRESMKGAEFKVNLQGKKYSFVVEEMLFRGPVRIRQKKPKKSVDAQAKRQEAIDFISRHGWAAYLENRAFTANFGHDDEDFTGKARLVLLHCRNQTYLAALHTPAPAINLYVASSLDKIRQRLSRNVDTASLDI